MLETAFERDRKYSKSTFTAVSGDSIGGASDMAETISKVGVLFGDAAKGVEQFALVGDFTSRTLNSDAVPIRG